ncbi:unnamed protein product [Alopecurus aequalis]
MAAHDEGVDNMVVKVWVKQVRDVAYDVEDGLQEFAVRLRKQSWWRICRTLVDRRRVAKQMKELRSNVEDVSQRNMRYHLIKGSGSKTATTAEQSNISYSAVFGIDEARRAANQDKSKVDLAQLINEKENDLRVIAVWGTSVDLGQTSIIRAVYENQETEDNFSCRAWVRLIHPFNPKDFIQSLVEQFHMGVGAKALLGREKTSEELAETFDEFLSLRRYLVVINDLNTIELWDRVKSCFPNNNMGSRIIVSTPQVEVASICAGHESIVSELKQWSANQNIYAFHDKVPISSGNETGNFSLGSYLEDTAGLYDSHLKHIGKLLHLRYLSLRGCDEIHHLPDSLGNLRELQTLDVRGTGIIKRPKSIINLQKLCNLRAGMKPGDEDFSYEKYDLEGVMGYRVCLLPLISIILCFYCCAPKFMSGDDNFSQRDACTMTCCNLIPTITMHLDNHGVLVPRGMRKLKALRTLGVVNIARCGKSVQREIRGLTGLHKLAVTGVNKENGEELCSSIVGLSRLESLSIRSEGKPRLSGCLDGKFSFPENLQKLKLYG